MKGRIELRKFAVFFTLLPSMACATSFFEIVAPPSFADHFHLSHSKDPVDGGWLPKLTGLPDLAEVEQTQQTVEGMMADKDTKCASIDSRLRKLMYQHFILYQKMANSQGIYLNENNAEQWAHILAMILKESSGDSTSVTDMRGESLSTFQPTTNLERWAKISSLTPQTRIPLNYQTNFGLTQTSADRLIDAFHLANDLKYDTAFLEGQTDAIFPRKIDLNTAIAIRRVIWLYQDFAQGRLVDTDRRIPEADINKPEFSARYHAGINMALTYCGTRYLFDQEKDPINLQNAMASIAYCKLGNPATGYGTNEMDEQCFAKWVTLCPALNIDIAALTPLSYFATRNESPVCVDTIKSLLNKNPNGETGLLRYIKSIFD